MAEAGSAGRLRMPGIATMIMAIAIICAGGMLITSYFTKLTPGAALLYGDPVDRVQAVEVLIKRGREGVPDLITALQNSRRETRISALFGLGRIGPFASDALDTIREALSDPEPTIRSVATGTFWQIYQNPEGAVPILVPMLDDPNDSVREASEKTLEDIGIRDAKPLVDALIAAPDATRIRLWSILHRVSRGGRTTDVVGLVRTLLEHFDSVIRDEALLTLVRWHKGSVAEIRQLFELGDVRLASSPTNDPDATAMDVALVAMKKLGPEMIDFLPDVLALLDRQDLLEECQPVLNASQESGSFDCVIHHRFQNLLDVLSKMGPAALSATPLLVSRLDRIQSSNRISIVKTLVEIGCEPHTVIPVLVPYLFQQNPEVATGEFVNRWKSHENARQAAGVLVKASPDEARRQVPRLLSNLGDIDSGVNKTTLYSLAGLWPVAEESIATAMSPLVLHPDGEIRWVSIDTLTKMGPDSACAVPSLMALLDRNLTTRDPESTRQVLKAIGQIGPAAKSAVPSLIKVIENPNIYVESLVPAIVIGESGLSSGTMHWSELIRLAAISALGKVADPTPDVMFVLCRQLQGPLPDRRVAALKALKLAGEASDPLLDEILPTLRDEISSVRVQAALTLAKLTGDRKRAVPPLEALLSDDSLYVKQAAVMALGSIGPDAESALAHLRSLPRDNGKTELMDSTWYARMTRISNIPSWFDDTPDVEQQSFDQSVQSAIAAIDRSPN